eukprot:10867109-Prorocentrum_lima.AAC.1
MCIRDRQQDISIATTTEETAAVFSLLPPLMTHPTEPVVWHRSKQCHTNESAQRRLRDSPRHLLPLQLPPGKQTGPPGCR